ncbi:protein eva-1 homolog C isoform X5 [Carcharodon carcharias]|uniref:protein eva-1 homolog C isoform X5 n=1 Tax=Carcharodon carcharias TaxID=13397 RepID=UPI001B7DCD6B|nr:protein eva-1 homolog C isoform X5 [Carcharodon carcharias]
MPRLDGRQRRQIPVLVSVIYFILIWTKEMDASGIFSDYLSKVLRRHTEQACDGGHLNLYCPRDTTISIQSAFYGRKVPSSLLCPGLHPRNAVEENLNCTAPTTLQKILDECQDQQSCQLPVNRRVFGLDPCPGTSKYLLVSYKCKPNEYKSKVACEGKELKLRCKNSTLINIYSATYGRTMNGNKACPSNLKLPDIANKSLDPRESRFSMKGGKIVISTLVIFAYIKSNPEMVALLFVSSVCIGLIFTLCALVIRVSCRPDLQKICNRNSDDRKVDNCQDKDGNEGSNNDDEDESSDDDEESSSDFSFEGLTKLYGTLGSNSTEAAEIAERIERRDRIIQEIWMNGGSELPVIRNLNQYY